jgi:hypothetical protein
MRWRFGNFSLLHETSALTGNRDVAWPDKSGKIALDSDIRPPATSQPIYYVNPTGSDSNDGLTAGTPFLTLPRAIDALTKIDCNGFDPIINLAPGDYLVYAPIILKNAVGVGVNVSIVGTGANNTTTRILSGNQGGNGGYANSVIVNSSIIPYLFQNLTISHQWDDVAYPTYPKYIVNEAGKLTFNNVRVLGNGASHDVFSGYVGANWIFLSNLDIQGTFRWVFDLGGGAVNLRQITINSISNPTFAIFIKSFGTYFAAFAISLSGSATGKRFEVVDSVFDAVDSTLYLPGSIAGTNTYPS